MLAPHLGELKALLPLRGYTTMSVKFRIGLTIDGETLFGLIAKMLPIEDLSVEEVPRFKKQVADSLPPPKKIGKGRRLIPNPVRLDKGINGVIMKALEGGPKRSVEMQPMVLADGFSINSLSSRLEELRKRDIVERNNGVWRKK
jgi:hypothetical protein